MSKDRRVSVLSELTPVDIATTNGRDQTSPPFVEGLAFVDRAVRSCEQALFVLDGRLRAVARLECNVLLICAYEVYRTFTEYVPRVEI